MTDLQIDQLLNKINQTDGYNYNQIRDVLPQSEYENYHNQIIYLRDDLKLIKSGAGRRGNLILTPKGNEVIKNGGWIQNNSSIKSNEKLENNLTRWKYYAFWPLFIIALIGAAYNFIDFKKAKNIELEIQNLRQKQKNNDSIIFQLQKSMKNFHNHPENLDTIKTSRKNLK